MTLDAQVADATDRQTFADLPLAPFLKETIRSVGYETPTPIQAETIPVILEGRDVIGLAQTGTGKTAAFVIPLIQKLSGKSERATRALILAPTRELAEQINSVIKDLSQRSGLKSVTVYGGVSHSGQVSKLRVDPQIVVACPGRLKDHMRGGTIDLTQIEHLILDEADRMLDMGFLPDIKEIVRAIPTERQTLLFSATMPAEIRELSSAILRNPVTVRVKTELPIATITHSMYTVKQEEKADRLTVWLQENPEAVTVVFTKMKHTARKLAEKLSKIGVRATSLQGNLSQSNRQRALNGFKDGSFRIMIATDIASRGIDVDGITHVINFDMPDTLDAYIHRTGRAGRAARNGDAVSFVTRSDREILRSIEGWLKAPLALLNKNSPEGSDSIDNSLEAPTRKRLTPRNERRRPRAGRREREETRRTSPEKDTLTDDRQFTRDERSSSRGRFERRDRDDRPQRPYRNARPDRIERSSRDQRPEYDQRQSRSYASNGDSSFGRPRQPRPEGERQERGFRGRGYNERSGQPSRFSRGGEQRPRRDDRSSGQGGGQRQFRGQQDIDSRAHYVYRPEGSHFIDRSDPDARPRRGSSPRGGRPRGPRGQNRGFQR